MPAGRDKKTYMQIRPFVSCGTSGKTDIIYREGFKKMKKITIILLVCVAQISWAYGVSPDLSQAVRKAVLSAVAENASLQTAHEQSVVPVTFKVRELLDSPDATPQTLEKSCTAVRIADQYLLASMACVGLEKTVWRFVNEPEGPAIRELNVISREVMSVVVEPAHFTIPQEAIYTNRDARVILIRWENHNKPMVEQIGPLPIANLFVPKHPQELKNIFPQPLVNHRYYFSQEGRMVHAAQMSEVNLPEGVFLVNWKWVDAQTGDPVFGVTQDQQEFLIGFNVTEPDIQSPRSGNRFAFFSAGTVEFLRRNMAKQSFAQISPQIADESHFNETQNQ